MRYRVPARVAYVIDDRGEESPLVYLMQLPDGEALVLQGSGGVIWAFAAEGEDDVPGAVAAAMGCPIEDIRQDVSDFLDELVARGLLDVSSGPTAGE